MRLLHYYLLGCALASPCVHAQSLPPVITEMMIDPTPTVALPDAEYVELYNPDTDTLHLTEWSIASGGRPRALSGAIPPHAYLLLVDDDRAADFAHLSVVTLAIDLPGLTNTGDNVSLLHGADTIVSIDYTRAWYQDPERDDGGYSLSFTALSGEDAGCKGRWQSSVALSGGTPGRENEVLHRPVDTVAPRIERLHVEPRTIRLDLDELPRSDQEEYLLLRGDREIPVLGTFRDQTTTSLTLQLGEPLLSGTRYQLEVPALRDCVGNEEPARTIPVVLPATPAPGDVVINELLFNPARGGSDFVELYNCSDSVFDVQGWILRNETATTTNVAVTVSGHHLFFPGDWLVITADPEDLAVRYPGVEPRLLVGQSLPSLPDDRGYLKLFASDGVLDSLRYDRNLHSPFLADDDGVSLERIRYKGPSDDPENWYSAAASASFATPTQPNSQRRGPDRTQTAQPFRLARETFSPDLDGSNEQARLDYADLPVGSLARIRIFDIEGYPVRTLRDIELLAASGSITWDGTDNGGSLLPSGAYIFLIELLHPEGATQRQHLTLTLAR